MSKDKGIVLKFSKDLVGDVTGLYPPRQIDPSKFIDFKKIEADISGPGTTLEAAFYAESYNSSFGWNINSSNKFFIIDFRKEGVRKRVSSIFFRSNAYFTGIKIEGSNDGEIYTEIHSETLTVSTYEYTWTIPRPEEKEGYGAFKITLTTSATSIRVHQIKVYEYVVIGNEIAFTITGKEQEHLGGQLVNSTYIAKSVERWRPSGDYGDDFLLIKLNNHTRMRKPEGPIKIRYSKSLGTLRGDGGARVEDFEIEFTPSDLIILPNPPPTEENIKATTRLDLDFIAVTHVKLEDKEENIKVSTALNLSFINITGMYP